MQFSFYTFGQVRTGSGGVINDEKIVDELEKLVKKEFNNHSSTQHGGESIKEEEKLKISGNFLALSSESQFKIIIEIFKMTQKKCFKRSMIKNLDENSFIDLMTYIVIADEINNTDEIKKLNSFQKLLCSKIENNEIKFKKRTINCHETVILSDLIDQFIGESVEDTVSKINFFMKHDYSEKEAEEIIETLKLFSKQNRQKVSDEK